MDRSLGRSLQQGPQAIKLGPFTAAPAPTHAGRPY
jgi:hypothetical protein